MLVLPQEPLRVHLCDKTFSFNILKTVTDILLLQKANNECACMVIAGVQALAY